MKTAGRFCARPSQQEQQGLLGAEQYQNGATRTQISPVSCRENTVFRGRLNVRWVSPHRAECSDGIQGTWRFICCFCDWKSFRQVGGEAPAAPVGAEIKSEVTDAEKLYKITHICSQKTYKSWTRRRFLELWTSIPGLLQRLRASTGSALNSAAGGHGPHAAWSEYSQQWTCFCSSSAHHV